MNPQDTDLKSLKNLGPKSAAWLRTVGIHTPGELRRTGALKAFQKIRKAGFRPSLNLLYALEGALQGVHWNRLSRDEKRRLVLSYDALEEKEAD